LNCSLSTDFSVQLQLWLSKKAQRKSLSQKVKSLTALVQYLCSFKLLSGIGLRSEPCALGRTLTFALLTDFSVMFAVKCCADMQCCHLQKKTFNGLFWIFFYSFIYRVADFWL